MRVHIWRCDIAPSSDRWNATAQEYDLDVPVGSGATPLEAIADLFWHLDIEDVDPVPVRWSDLEGTGREFTVAGSRKA